MMRPAIAVLIGLLAPGMTSAQTLITPDAFLDEATGKTLSFYEIESGELVGVEQFLNRSLSVWREPGQPCVYGKITTPEGRICFAYDNRQGPPVCWWPFMRGDQLMVRLDVLLNAEIQEVRAITSAGIDCPNAPTS
ncbi:hypothetical protein Q5Y75_11350 [Ruegeria sp. 2205SS24-7]|uniref:hypothetical protein n=1 Tax=Ruegeria discodermiae TaxID=3064389 RepID=UPI0027424094|nr:hypothetical protein [Ruegeria sp. 2205SS24-7]MDP5217817.1 hypothetical protein [Ruegeria sp. 2205SS24-7]